MRRLPLTFLTSYILILFVHNSFTRAQTLTGLEIFTPFQDDSISVPSADGTPVLIDFQLNLLFESSAKTPLRYDEMYSNEGVRLHFVLLSEDMNTFMHLTDKDLTWTEEGKQNGRFSLLVTLPLRGRWIAGVSLIYSSENPQKFLDAHTVFTVPNGPPNDLPHLSRYGFSGVQAMLH